MVLPAQLVEDGAANAGHREGAERQAARGIERGHRRHQAQGAGADQLVVIELVAQLALELPGNVVHETEIVGEEQIAGGQVAVGECGPLGSGFHVSSSVGNRKQRARQRAAVRPRAREEHGRARVASRRPQGIRRARRASGHPGADRGLQTGILRYRAGDVDGATEEMGAGTHEELAGFFGERLAVAIGNDGDRRLGPARAH